MILQNNTTKGRFYTVVVEGVPQKVWIGPFQNYDLSLISKQFEDNEAGTNSRGGRRITTLANKGGNDYIILKGNSYAIVNELIRNKKISNIVMGDIFKQDNIVSVSYGPNLITDGGFEEVDTIENWNDNGTAFITIETGIVKSGLQSVRIRKSDIGGAGVRNFRAQNIITPLSVGKTYFLEGYLYKYKGPDSTLRCFLADGGNVIAGLNLEEGENDDWYYKSNTFTLNLELITPRIVLSFNSISKLSKGLFDDISLREIL